jgi:Lhr-like helicase
VIRDQRMAKLLRRNLGTIIGEDARSVRLLGADGKAVPLGRLDQPFADRLQAGSCFLLDSRSVRVRSAEGAAITVEELPGRPGVPRWGSEGAPLSRELAGRLYLLRSQAAEALRGDVDALDRLLREDYGLEEPAIEMLTTHFRMQESLSEIPENAICLVEAVRSFGGVEYYFHTPLHRAANDALARVAAFRLARHHDIATTSLVADLGFMLHVESAGALEAALLRRLLAADCFEADLTAALADSPILRERFRRVATTGLMILRNPAGHRRHVGGSTWEERRLFDRIRAIEPDFVLLRQMHSELREESCDVHTAQHFAAQMPRLELHIRLLAEASPFAQSWSQPAVGPVEMIGTPTDALTRLHAVLLRSGDAHASTHRLAADA